MKCEKCGKNEATTYYKETVNGKTREMHLCADCAQKMQVGGNFFGGDLFGHDFFGGGLLDSFFGNTLAAPSQATSHTACPTCGRTAREIRQTGRVGCGQCYDVFADLLLPYIEEVQGCTRQVQAANADKPAAPEDPLTALKAQLHDVLAREEYEKAAELRDQIRKLEGGDAK